MKKLDQDELLSNPPAGASDVRRGGGFACSESESGGTPAVWLEFVPPPGFDIPEAENWAGAHGWSVLEGYPESPRRIHFSKTMTPGHQAILTLTLDGDGVVRLGGTIAGERLCA